MYSFIHSFIVEGVQWSSKYTSHSLRAESHWRTAPLLCSEILPLSSLGAVLPFGGPQLMTVGGRDTKTGLFPGYWGQFRRQLRLKSNSMALLHSVRTEPPCKTPSPTFSSALSSSFTALTLAWQPDFLTPGFLLFLPNKHFPQEISWNSDPTRYLRVMSWRTQSNPEWKSLEHVWRVRAGVEGKYVISRLLSYRFLSKLSHFYLSASHTSCCLITAFLSLSSFSWCYPWPCPNSDLPM